MNYYKIKEVQEVPCKTIQFLYDIKNDLEVYSYNCKKYLQCFLKFHDVLIKEYLSDLILKGVQHIIKSGHNSPVSTFFTNVLIIEGPKRLKDELFASFYDYIDTTADLSSLMSRLVNLLIEMSFDEEAAKLNKEHFI